MVFVVKKEDKIFNRNSLSHKIQEILADLFVYEQSRK